MGELTRHKVLTDDGKRAAARMFMGGVEMSDVASRFGVSRRHIEQLAREAIQSLSERVVNTKSAKEPQTP